MSYQATVEAKNRVTALILIVVLAITVWLTLFHALAFAFILGPLLVWAIWCVLGNQKWTTRVENGHIVWSSLLLHREQSLPTADVASIELRRDSEGGVWLYLRLKNQRRKRFDVPERMGDFISAVLDENPAVEVKPIGWFWE